MTLSGARSRGLLALCWTVALVTAACGATPTVSPPPTSTPTQAAQATPTLADTIRIALPICGYCGTFSSPFGPLSNGPNSLDGGNEYIVNLFLHDALYRYDEHVKPVPSLARSCDPSADGLTITCQLIEATFQNGDPVTADDVVFTYRVMAANTHVESAFTNGCAGDVAVGFSGCLWEVLDSVTKLDDRTVAFRLKRPYAPFFTLALPEVWIDSEKVVRAAYDAFRAKAATVTANELEAEAKRLADQVNSPAGDCSPLLQDATQLTARAGLFVPDQVEYDYLPGGEFDACGYAAGLSLELAQAAASLGADEITSIALVYQSLAFVRAPVGAGPYKLKDYEPGKRVELEAWPGWHGGAPATRTIVFQIYPDEDAAVKAVLNGAADAIELGRSADIHQLSDVPSLRTGYPVLPGTVQMIYNVRPGRLFADVRLRQAVELCLEKPAAAIAATDGRGLPAYGPVPPGIWTYDDRLAKPARDVAAAKALIESAGWALGSDGIYLKDGKPLAATIYLRTDQSDRFKFAKILSRQVRDCGIDLKPSQSDFNGGLQGIFSWPNHAPDTDQPFDLFLIGSTTGWEPIPDSFGSDQITTEANPDGNNFGGFSDPRVDDLLHRIETTYSPDLRANLSRQAQEVLAEQQPALFAWHYSRAAAAATGLRTLDGPLNLDSPRWYAFPERLVLDVASGA